LDRTTSYVSPNQVTASISSGDIALTGTASVTVFNPAPGGGLSNAQTFTINSSNPVPTTTSLSPASANAGGPGFTLTINGTGFVNGSVVRWNGLNRTTSYVSPNQVTASISSGDIAVSGTVSVTVFNPAPGGGLSNAQTFTINSSNPVPTTTSLSPALVTAGGTGFTLTVNGTGFVNGSVIRWNGLDRTTSYVSSNQVTASIPSGDIAVSGTVSVTVFNPAPGGGLSNAQTFTINSSSTSQNIASLATVTASSETAQWEQVALKAVDGVVDGYPGDYTREWATAGEKAGAWIQLTWSSAYMVDRVVLYDRPNSADQILSGTLTFSDGSTIPVGTLSNDGTGVVFTFPPKTVTSVRLTVNQASSSTQNIGLSEIEVFGN